MGAGDSTCLRRLARRNPGSVPRRPARPRRRRCWSSCTAVFCAACTRTTSPGLPGQWLDAGVAVAIVTTASPRPRRSTDRRPDPAQPGLCGMRRHFYTAMIAVAWWCPFGRRTARRHGAWAPATRGHCRSGWCSCRPICISPALVAGPPYRADPPRDFKANHARPCQCPTTTTCRSAVVELALALHANGAFLRWEADGHPKTEIVLNESERKQLEAWTRRRRPAGASRCGRGSFLECATGVTDRRTTPVGVAADGVEVA